MPFKLGILFSCRGRMLVFHIRNRVFHVRADLGSFIVLLKFLFGFVNQRFNYSSVCSFL